MKRIFSLIMCLTVAFAWIPTIGAASTSSQGLSVDFSKYKVGKAFKQYCDESGNYVENGYTFKMVEDGLQYKRDKDEVFYNPSKAVKTTLPAYKTFPFSEDGSGKGYRLKSDTAYQIVLNYNLKSISDDAEVVLGGRAAQYDGSADVAYITNSKAITMYSDAEMTKTAVIKELGGGTLTAYFKCDGFNSVNSKIWDALFLVLNSTNASDVELVISSMSIKPISAIEVHYSNGTVKNYVGEPGSVLNLSDLPVENKETYYYGSLGEYTIKSVKLYNDEALTDLATNVVFPDSGTKILYGIDSESCGTANQVAFCGFDAYSLRNSSIAGNKDFALISGVLSKSSSITDEEAYSGNKSLKIVSDGNTSQDYTCNYIGNGYEMEEGITYQLKLRYKSANTNNNGGVSFKFGCGANRDDIPDIIGNSSNEYTVSKTELNADTDWHEATMVFTADIGNRKNLKTDYQNDGYKLLAPILNVIPNGGAVSLYIDSIVISRVAIKEDAELITEGSQSTGISLAFSYYSDSNGKLSLAGNTETVKEYGIIIGNADEVKNYELNLTDSADNSKIKVYKSDNLEKLYDSSIGKMTFKVNVSADKADSKISARGYVRLSDDKVYYSSVNTQSINSIENKDTWDDVYYQVKKPSTGVAYSSFEVYTKSSVSNIYYINYHFVYTEKAAKPELEFGGGTDDGANQKTYRIIGADLVKKSGNTFTKVNQLLQNGEIEFAFSETGAGDFVGGFHGDEIMEFAELQADGKTVDLTKESQLASCKQLVFETKTKMFRCNSDTVTTPAQQVNSHTLKYTVTSKDGIKLEQSLNWLVSDLKIRKAMACMFTVYRCTDKNERITDILEYHKWDGSVYDVFDVSNVGPKESLAGDCSYSGPSYVNIYGKDSGIFAKVGYKVEKGLQDVFCNTYSIRQYNDNKPYFSVNEKTTVKSGEEWRWVNYYNLDYRKKDAESAYTVKINAGANMTLVSGNAEQEVTGSITPVVYRANDGYRFADDYSVAGKNGINVKRVSDTEIEVYGTPTANTELTLTAPEKIPTVYTVKINAGANMTLASGAEVQQVTGSITPVVYKANEGYYFPADYKIAEDCGLSVKRVSDTEIEVSGTVNSNTEIKLGDAVKIPASKPEIIEGMNGKWSTDSKEGLAFRSNAEFDSFVCVLVDGIKIDGSMYTVKSGSTAVELKTEFLKTLAVGKHTITVRSTTGDATTEFTVLAGNQNSSGNTEKGNDNTVRNESPKTGEQSANIILITVISLTSLAAVILLLLYLKKAFR